ncbi:MAG: phenylacetate--CoA ligase family protein [Alteromonadaceae bacterium]|nr:phenylacetate--CoA ligase family protein [Alteromonadaceae bacterium]
MGQLEQGIYSASPVWAQNLLISVFGHYLFKKRYSGCYTAMLEQIRTAKNWSPEQRRAHQSEQLQAMAAHCRHHIPWYQKLFAEYGLHENDFTTPEDIKKLPVLDKHTLRKHQHEFRLPGAKPFMTQHTSGSTGTPLSVAVDAETYKLAMALLVDHEQSHGVPFGARRATFAGRMLQPSEKMTPPFWRMNRAENQLLFSSYHLSKTTFAWYRRKLEQFQPLELIGYPSAIADLAGHFLDSGLEPGFQPKLVVTNSETLLAPQREIIESVFRCPVMDYYGTAEYVIFAGQRADQHYHPSPLLGITELLSRSGEPDDGMLTATTLTNRTMPLLRYEIGDTATAVDDSQPRIGAPALASINGRKDDYIETSDGRRIGRVDHIFKGIEGVREAQVVQHQPGAITIRIVADDAGRLDTTALINNCRKRLGEDFQVTIEETGRIPRGANGKFRSVIRC